MKLKEAVLKIEYNAYWGIYADGTTPESEARFGAVQFDNGGVLDDKFFIMDGEQNGDRLLTYCDGDLEAIGEHFNGEDFVNWLNEGYFDDIQK